MGDALFLKGIVVGVTLYAATAVAWAEQVRDLASLEAVTELEAQKNDLESANLTGRESILEEVSYSQALQMGIDYWDLKKSLPTSGLSPSGLKSLSNRLYLADSQPQWKYKNPSAWFKYEGRLRLGGHAMVTAKYRADQSSGSRVDELSVDWGPSPSMGFRAGVLDYKTSWCRTYDLDSPWVRENDPFCVVRTTDQATGAAPGLQAYANIRMANYQLQTVGGVFRPMAFGYDKKEFSNTVITPGTEVQYNRKSVLAMNLVNIETGTEIRLSHQYTNQGAHYQPVGGSESYRQVQKANLTYGALAFYITSALSVRGTFLKSRLTWDCLAYSGSANLADFCDASIVKGSKTMELAYQAAPKDIVSLAYSRYEFDYDFDALYRINDEVVRFQSPDTLKLKHQSISVGWRRDWTAGLYTSVQFTRADLRQQTRGNYLPTPLKSARASGNAWGLRLGYQF